MNGKFTRCKIIKKPLKKQIQKFSTLYYYYFFYNCKPSSYIIQVGGKVSQSKFFQSHTKSFLGEFQESFWI